MKKVFVVMFDTLESHSTYVDSVFISEVEAQKYCDELNEWERSELGLGELWYFVRAELHE